MYMFIIIGNISLQLFEPSSLSVFFLPVNYVLTNTLILAFCASKYCFYLDVCTSE
jgi:hypothetical protein